MSYEDKPLRVAARRTENCEFCDVPIHRGDRLCILAGIRACRNHEHMLPERVQLYRMRRRERQRKVTDDQVRAIRRMAGDGWPQVRIAEDFGINQTNVSDIVRRRTFKDVT